MGRLSHGRVACYGHNIRGGVSGTSHVWLKPSTAGIKTTMTNENLQEVSLGDPNVLANFIIHRTVLVVGGEVELAEYDSSDEAQAAIDRHEDIRAAYFGDITRHRYAARSVRDNGFDIQMHAAIDRQ